MADEIKDDSDLFRRVARSLARWFHSEGGATEGPTATEEEGSRNPVAERINAALPDSLSAREAILKRRKRLRDMDEQTSQENN